MSEKVYAVMASSAPSEEQWAILSVVQRLEQIAQEGESPPLAALLWHRVLTCDVPRLRGLLSPETLQWAD